MREDETAIIWFYQDDTLMNVDSAINMLILIFHASAVGLYLP